MRYQYPSQSKPCSYSGSTDRYRAELRTLRSSAATNSEDKALADIAARLGGSLDAITSSRQAVQAPSEAAPEDQLVNTMGQHHCERTRGRYAAQALCLDSSIRDAPPLSPHQKAPKSTGSSWAEVEMVEESRQRAHHEGDKTLHRAPSSKVGVGESRPKRVRRNKENKVLEVQRADWAK